MQLKPQGHSLIRESTVTTVHLRTDYIDEDVAIRSAAYPNGSTALILEDPVTGEQVAVATVALAALPAAGNVYIKDYSENSGMLAALQRAGIVGEVVDLVQSGFVTVHEVKLLVSVPELAQ